MITAAALTFPRFHSSVTSLSGQPDAPAATVMTCSNATQITIYNCRISQTVFLALMAVPILMIVLSMMLPARANRTINLAAASLYIPVSIFNAVGESWTYFYGLCIGLEVLLLAFILRSAWTWPRTAAPATLAASLDSEPLRTPQQA